MSGIVREKRIGNCALILGDCLEVLPTLGKVDAVSSLTERLRKYADTGNTEFLVDAANFAMIEFMHPSHPDAHFAGTDDDQSPGRRSAKTGLLDKRDNSTIGTNPKSKLAEFR